MSPWKSEVAYPSRNLGMNSPSEYFNGIESRELGSQNAGSNGIHKNGSFLSIYGEVEAKHRLLLVQWLSGLIPSLYFPINVTDGELRACLSDGTVLCQILNKLRPGTVSEPDNFLPSQSENVRTFLRALDAMGLPRFEISDLEKGSMKAVVDCLLTLRAKSLQNALGDGFNTASPRNVHGSPTVRLEPRRGSFGSRLQNVLSSGSIKAGPFHEVFQLKPASYADLPASKISEMLKSNSLDNAPTQSLLSVVDGILEESVARRNGEIPHRVVCLLKKVTQEIERRISTQAEHLRTQNNLFKAREEKYQSRIRVLEALASGNGDESETQGMEEIEIAISRSASAVEGKGFFHIDSPLDERKTRQEVLIRLFSCYLYFGLFGPEKIKEEEKVDQKEVVRLMKEQVDNSLEISALKQDLEIAERTYEVQFSQLEEETRGAKAELTQKVQEYEHQLEELRNKVQRMKEEEKKAHEKEEEDKVLEISALKEALEKAKSIFEVQCSQLEEAKGAKAELTHKLQEYERQSEELKNKAEKIKEEEKKAREREKEHTNLEISTLKQELETTKIAYEVQCLHLEAEAMDAKAELSHKSQEFEHQLEELRNTVEKIKKEEKRADREIVRLMKEQENKNLEISALKQELETSKKSYEIQCSQLEGEANGTKAELRQKSQEYEHRLEELRNKVKELEASSHSEHQKWNMKLNQLQTLILFQFSSLQTLKLSWESIKQDVVKQQMVYADECSRFGVNLKSLVNAAENYHVVLAENRQLFNEVQELKGNIRVYCRIKPFLLGKKEKQSIVDHIGENDLVIANPTKEGRDVPRSFKFTKVFGPTTTQAEVYSDIQSFVRSVLDGYNVCIFAYGQTGSGKTYTMTGPNGATSETIGVNFRALNDLFKISTSRSGFIAYDIGVQMVEIYNEQVRDLLTDGSAKRYPLFFMT
ncbi:hypothetical protein RJT34_04757 [Clitoria ternatea]|uniref:Uncharacterized protein n=1 Tax=Clitoria ternatea TaxID=43366 RepID=A0AAN9Q6H8_CLITE